MTDAAPVIVGACPRSGTTMFRSMLHAHPELALPRETRFVLETYRRRGELGDLARERNRKRVAKWIVGRKQSRVRRLDLDAQELRARIVDAGPTLGSLLAAPFTMYAEQQGASRWGDKRPMYVQHLDAIFSLFPDAQFVNIVRDPRGAIASMRQLGWFEGDVTACLELWLRSVGAARSAQGRLRSDQYLELRYEDLVREPHLTLSRACRFLGVHEEALDSMVNFHELGDVPENRYHWRVSQPVTETTLASWTSKLDADEVAFIEHKARREMERQGYERAVARRAPSPHLELNLKRRQVAMGKRRLKNLLHERDQQRRHPYPVAAARHPRAPESSESRSRSRNGRWAARPTTSAIRVSGRAVSIDGARRLTHKVRRAVQRPDLVLPELRRRLRGRRSRDRSRRRVPSRRSSRRQLG